MPVQLWKEYRIIIATVPVTTLAKNAMKTVHVYILTIFVTNSATAIKTAKTDSEVVNAKVSAPQNIAHASSLIENVILTCAKNVVHVTFNIILNQIPAISADVEISPYK